MATSLLSPTNLSVAEVSAQCVFLAVESCGEHGKRFDGNIAPSGSVTKVADHPRFIGKLIKDIDVGCWWSFDLKYVFSVDGQLSRRQQSFVLS